LSFLESQNKTKKNRLISDISATIPVDDYEQPKL